MHCFIFCAHQRSCKTLVPMGAKAASKLNANNARCHNLANGKEASEVTGGKSSGMRWGR